MDSVHVSAPKPAQPASGGFVIASEVQCPPPPPERRVGEAESAAYNSERGRGGELVGRGGGGGIGREDGRGEVLSSPARGWSPPVLPQWSKEPLTMNHEERKMPEAQKG